MFVVYFRVCCTLWRHENELILVFPPQASIAEKMDSVIMWGFSFRLYAVAKRCRSTPVRNGVAEKERGVCMNKFWAVVV